MGECGDSDSALPMLSLRQDWLHRPTQTRVWRLAAPMILSNLTVPLVTLVDSMMAGHLSHAGQLGAVAVGSAIYGLPIWVFGFLRMGTIGFAAQASGRADGDALRRLLLQALLLAVGLACATALLAWPLLGPVLHLMKPSATLDELTRSYLHVRLFGLPAALVNAALVGWFLGMHNAGMALRMTVVTNVVNIVLNLVFVLGLHAGVVGIAASSVCGEWIGAIVGLAGISAQLRHYPGQLKARALRRWAAWRPLIAVNRDILIRSLALQGVFFAVTVLGTRMGDSVVAANALLLNGLLVTAFALDGLANAVEALTGHAVGAGDRRRPAPCTGRRRRLVADRQRAVCAVLRPGRAVVRRPADRHRVGSRDRLSLSALSHRAAAGRRVELPARRPVRRRHPGPRDARCDAAGGHRLCPAGVYPARPGQPRPVAGFPRLHALRAGTMAWMAWRIARRDGWVSASET